MFPQFLSQNLDTDKLGNGKKNLKKRRQESVSFPPNTFSLRIDNGCRQRKKERDSKMIPQRRRRRGMLLALFVFFFIIFLFDTPTEQSESEKEKEVEAQLRDEKKREVPSIFKEEELDALKRILGNLESGTKYPAEITGEFSGEWGGEVDESLKESLLTPKDDLEKTSDENVRIVA